MDATAIIDADGEVTASGSTDPVPWWSFTKTVLSIATLRLAGQGALGLDDRLPGEPFTARQLLRHEAGLPCYATLSRYHADVAAGKPPWPVDRLLEAACVTRLRCRPGAGWAYSNIGYLRVAQCIERVSGRGLSAALADLVFDPAHLSGPRLARVPNDLADVQMGGASGYHPGWVYHGLLVGTASDAARLPWLLVNGRSLRPASLETMMRRRALPEHRSVVQPDPACGLGLMLAAEDPASHPLGDGGGRGAGSRSMPGTAGPRRSGGRSRPISTPPRGPTGCSARRRRAIRRHGCGTGCSRSCRSGLAGVARESKFYRPEKINAKFLTSLSWSG